LRRCATFRPARLNAIEPFLCPNGRMMPNDVIEKKNRRTYRHTRMTIRLLADPDKIVSSASEFREISFEQSHCLSLKRSRSYHVIFAKENSQTRLPAPRRRGTFRCCPAWSPVIRVTRYMGRPGCSRASRTSSGQRPEESWWKSRLFPAGALSQVLWDNIQAFGKGLHV